MNPTDPLTTLFGHHRWANLRILECCAGLSDEQLDATLLGTFGSIRDTLQHIVAAERVTGLPQRLCDDTMRADASTSLLVDRP